MIQRGCFPVRGFDAVREEHGVCGTCGIEGGGEGGRMALAAISVRVNVALAPLGVRITELPMTPDRILAVIGRAREQA